MAREVPGIPEHLLARRDRYTADDLVRLRRICEERSISRRQLAVLLLRSSTAAEVEAQLLEAPPPVVGRSHW